MPKFSSGQITGDEDIRSAKWVDTNDAFTGHVVRTAIGTAGAAEYCHSASDLPWGVLYTEGTQNNYVSVAVDGQVLMANSANGTVNLGDPVILDYANSGGTTGFVRSAYTSEAIASIAAGGRVPLKDKAVPGSVRISAGGTAFVGVLDVSGTTIYEVTGTAWPGGNIYYQIDQPVIGIAREKATTPGQLFKVDILKERYIKNNVSN